MTDPLAPYRAKRDPDRTPEPPGAGGPAPGPAPSPAAVPGDALPLRFVVQEHHARRLHWDLRLERDGVLVSWAVPKGIPPHPDRDHLAVHTEDHPLEYLTFHGEIPAGQYGAGTMTIWDTGTYETDKFRPDEVMVTFHGERLRGRYVLFRTRGEDWMIHRMDPPADPERQPLPERLAPMLAGSGRLPTGAGWAFEVKWDGIRALGYAEGGRLRLETRNGRDVTTRYPELRALGEALGATQGVLDGEIVAFGPDGRPSFQALQRRMHLTSESAARRLAEREPVAYVLFDLLFHDGRDLCPLPYAERRERLLALGLSGPTWQTPAHHVGDGAALLEASRAQGLEGILAKRLDSPYLPGRRASSWIKVKNVRRTDVVVGGWLPGEGGRSGRLGALLVGCWEGQKLRYAGRVGTGYTQAELARLGGLLAPLSRPTSPFTGRQPPRAARYVEPVMVAEVDYGEWTQARTLRHPSYKGMRDDIDPREVGFPADAGGEASDAGDEG